MKIKTIVVDDEPLARKRILDLLSKEKDIEMVSECRDGFAALEEISRYSPELLFLDVQMPEKNGFEVVKELPKDKWPVIIFVTAYDQYALKAFEVHALDYLLKPFDDNRFRQALERARGQIQQKQNDSFNRKLLDLIQSHERETTPEKTLLSNEEPLDRFVIKERGEALLIKAKDVNYIEGEGVYVRLYLNGHSYLLRERMTELDNRLDSRTFFRIHRSTIVNLERIQKLIPHFHGDYIVVLHDGTHLKLSRSRRERLQARLGASF